MGVLKVDGITFGDNDESLSSPKLFCGLAPSLICSVIFIASWEGQLELTTQETLTQLD